MRLVNLVLVESSELSADATCAISDRRARHLREVLHVTPGSTVRAGIVGGAIGTAEVISDDGESIFMKVNADSPPPAPMDVELLLALPRPKVLTRVVETCAAFAIRRLDLTNAWRVDKSYSSSPRLDPGALALAARFGAEQGATTWQPAIAVHERLMELLDGRFPPSGGPLAMRVIAHPGAPPIERVITTPGPVVLAIGPEGGWIQRELDTFVARGFAPVSLGAPILRVEAAVAAALGQLMLLARR